MTIIRRTRPVNDVTTFRSPFERFFDDVAFRPFAWGGIAESRLPLDITATEGAVTVEAALPGIHPEDVEITVHQDNLTIGVKEQAERETKEGERVYRELRRSSGSRTLTLPSGLDVDRATATFENGMLRLEIPRTEQAKPRQIPVKGVTEASTTTVKGSGDGVNAEPAQEPVAAGRS